MENLSRTFSRKTFGSSNGFAASASASGKSMYDDVFGGPPKFGVPALSPRAEDYTEIFGGFHTSRGSSPPILDLPLVDNEDSDISFDVRSSKFDYSEVFGGFRGLDFAVSYEELFRQSNSANDSSEEAWTPAQSDSLSDESKPAAFSETIQVLSDGDTDHSYDGNKEFHISYHRANQKRNRDMSNGTTHITQLHNVPGFSFVVDEDFLSREVKDDNPPLHATCDLSLDKISNGDTEGKQFRKTMSLPPRSSSVKQAYPREPKFLGGYGRSSSFITVSDISLQTQPSRLPPPSRPPPPLVVLEGTSGGTNSTFEASKSYSSEGMEGDSSPPYFDVEIDANSSAAVSSANMKDIKETAKAKLKGPKDSMEKEEGAQTHTKLHLGNNAKVFERKSSDVLDGSKLLNDETVQGTHETVQGTHERECRRMKPFTGKERQKVMKNTHIFSGSVEDESQICATRSSAVTKRGKDRKSSQGYHVTEGTVAWREATEFYEVVQLDESKRVFDQMKNEKMLHQTIKSVECQWDKQRATETFGLQQDDGEVRVASTTSEHQTKMGLGPKGLNTFMDGSKAAKISFQQGEDLEKVEVTEKVYELKDNLRAGPLLEEITGSSNEAVRWEECENLMGNQWKGDRAKVGNGKTEIEKNLKDVDESKENQGQSKEIVEEESGRRQKDSAEQAEKVKKLEALELEAKKRQQIEAFKREEGEKKQEGAQDKEELKNKLKGDFKLEEKERKRLEGTFEQERSDKKLKVNLEKEGICKLQKLACEIEENEKRLQKVGKQEDSKHGANPPFEQVECVNKQEKACEEMEKEKKPSSVLEDGDNEWRLREVHKQEGKNRLPKAHEIEESQNFREKGVKKKSKEAKGWEEITRFKTAVGCEGLEGQRYCCEDKLKLDHETHLERLYNSDVSEGFCKLDENNAQVCRLATEHDRDIGKTEAIGLLCDQDTNLLVEEVCNSSSIHEDELQHEESEARVKSENEAVSGIAQTNVCDNKAWVASTQKNANSIPQDLGERASEVQGVYLSFDLEGSIRKFSSSQVVRELVGNGLRNAQPFVLEGEGKANIQSSVQKLTSQNTERKEKNLVCTLKPEEREKEEKLKRERELENDRLRKIEEERERQREREKDRMAVDRATFEVRERGLVEARSRAARAAVERATAEVRQRAMAEPRERMGKASAEVRDRSFTEKASVEALWAERAAVERATAEARERAVEKAMAEKVAFEARERAERSVAEKFSASSRSGGMRHSSSSSDLQSQSGMSFSGLRYSYSSVHGGFEGESAQRCKARLERHRRTAERAAKALAEKNMRDLFAQREQAERNRLAEALDAEVRRWSSNKEGNLRALLSTLQYILGPDSGWQPIPLTEVITSVAVKKAYRKATLCVHPDKLQQRGASIQQKYICEKVFDLLKEAWNKFNSEEL